MTPFILYIFASLVLIIYIALIIRFALAWDKIKEQPTCYNKNQITKISCIIPFRNEENNLDKLMKCIQKQTLHPDYFEMIFVDDHSTDHSYDIIKELIAGKSNYSLIKNLGQGKKKAISTAVAKTKNEYIITTDADCIFSPNWLKSISQYIYKYSPDLIIGPVGLKGSSNFFSQFQIIEFLSLVTSGAGAAGMKKPIMCNGANLVVKKDILKQAQTTIHNNYASGDDIFLLQFCIKNEKSIHFLKSKDAIVHTHTIDKPKLFFSQRMRWTSKSKGYTDAFTLAVAWIVLLANTTLLLTPIIAFFDFNMGATLILLGLFKNLTDYILIKKGASFFQLKLSPKKIILSQLAYPFYIFLTVTLAFWGTTHWKNRKI